MRGRARAIDPLGWSRAAAPLYRLDPGAVAQWSEQGTHNPSVEGSIPSRPTTTERQPPRAMELDRRGRVNETAPLMATTSLEPTAPPPSARFETEEIVGYTRSASDVLRLHRRTEPLAVVVLLVTRYAEDAVLGFEEDFVAALSFLEPPAERILEGCRRAPGRRSSASGSLLVSLRAEAVPVSSPIWSPPTSSSGGPVGIVVEPGSTTTQPKQVANELAQRAGVNSAARSPRPASPRSRRRS